MYVNMLYTIFLVLFYVICINVLLVISINVLLLHFVTYIDPMEELSLLNRSLLNSEHPIPFFFQNTKLTFDIS